MTLDEMIKQEQNNVQNQQNSNLAQQVQAQQVQQTVQQVSQSVQQQNKQENNNGVISSTYTVASSSDKNVNKEEFSLKTKRSYEPIVVPEDFYTVKLVGIDKKEVKAFDSEEIVPNFIWKFELVSDSSGKQLEKPVTITKWCKAYSKGERSNNYQFYSAFTQQTPEYGYNILDCIGKYARAYIAQKSWIDQKTGVKITKSVIDKVLPLKK